MEEGNANLENGNAYREGVFLSLERKAGEAVLELDIAALNNEVGMEKLFEKFDTFFL